MILKFEILKDINGKKGKIFLFEIENMKFIKMLADSHFKVRKVVHGALCKKLLEELQLFLGAKLTLEDLNAVCRRVG